MSLSMNQRSLQQKLGQQADLSKKAASLRTKEASKRKAAAEAQVAATRTTSESTRKLRARQADQALDAANKAAQDAAGLEVKGAKLVSEIGVLQVKIARQQLEDSAKTERQYRSDARRAELERRRLDNRISSIEVTGGTAFRPPTPRPEKLRVLMLSASADGGLRIGREQDRIRKAVERAVHRDYIEFDIRAAATPGDLVDGISRFRPHVVHFSGHSNEQFVEFEADEDTFNDGIVVTASAFANACAATQTPPVLVVFNSCGSERIADRVVAAGVAPLAIGMTGDVEDGDALNFAAAFYAGLTNGHDVESAFLQGKSQVGLLGGADEVPYLAVAVDVAASAVVLVNPGESTSVA
ncbi:CHAT domain-containing protein [Kribbella sp. NPDC056345]|uniref:CHAT domain-containing protein n=1 Tax=Kribbella sp. NPDC056345 TaxID=3345789 RepID=UPI0035DA3741